MNLRVYQRARKRAALPIKCVTLMLLAIGAEGCAPSKAAPVNAELARASLRTALEGWKSGDRPDQMQSRSPSIVVQDVDWEAGNTLVEYDVAGDGKDDDANLRCPVTLTVKERTGREVKKRVRYVVGTSPVITVFREMF
jgi:hypothetical protein